LEDGEVYEYSAKYQVPGVKWGFVSCNFAGIMV